jgi:hypothetical protein
MRLPKGQQGEAAAFQYVAPAGREQNSFVKADG